MNDSDALIMVHTTCADADEAEQLARQLVDERLAACASVGQPVVSIFPWEGRIDRERECPLTLKSTRSGFDRLQRRITELHSYDVPEILAVEVCAAGEDYAGWVRDWTGGRPA